MDRQAINDRMEASLAHGIVQEIFPGAVTSLMKKGAPPLTVARGMTGYGAEAVPVDVHTLYDMASLTKVMVALPLVLLSVQEGKLSLTDKVTSYLPELADGHDAEAKQKMTIFHLLTHTSGLPAWRPYFLMEKGKSGYLRMMAAESMVYAPGNQVVYSDLGFMLIGFVLERIWDEELHMLANRLIFQPSQMVQTGYLPLEKPALAVTGIALTENGNGYEHNMAEQYLWQLEAIDSPNAGEWKEKLASFPWRQGVICGTVHDCNAHYGLGGISGHAGLFSTIEDVARYMGIWTSNVAPVRIDPILRAKATRSHTDPHLHRRGLGWIASATGGSLEQAAAGCSGGDLLSDQAFGHTGFTGTSIWSDPVRETTLITLTNRVHPVASPLIGKWRIAHHNQVFGRIDPDGAS